MNKIKYENTQLLDGDKLLIDKQQIAYCLSTFFFTRFFNVLRLAWTIIYQQMT